MCRQQTETARLAKLYAQYRVLAAGNRLIECLSVQMPAAARRRPDGPVSGQPDPAGAILQENSVPLPAMGPPGAGSAAACRSGAAAGRGCSADRQRAGGPVMRSEDGSVSFMNWLDAERFA